MPVWRPRSQWLHAAVESVLAEHDCSLELIAVDDGNEAPVANLLESVGDERLSLVRIDHSGPSGARNAGLARARGSFVRFVDSDDVVTPGSTARLLAVARRPSPAIAHGATIVCDEELRPTGRTMASTLEGDVARECVLGRFDTRIVSLLFPRTVVDAAGPFDTSFPVNGDWEFVLRALEHAPARSAQFAATLYRRHPSSTQGQAGLAESEQLWHRILDLYLERHPELRGSDFDRKARATIYLNRAAAYASRGELGRAVNALLRGGRLAPIAALSSARLLVRRRPPVGPHPAGIGDRPEA